MNLNLNSHMWLVATILASESLAQEEYAFQSTQVENQVLGWGMALGLINQLYVFYLLVNQMRVRDGFLLALKFQDDFIIVSVDWFLIHNAGWRMCFKVTQTHQLIKAVSWVDTGGRTRGPLKFLRFLMG